MFRMFQLSLQQLQGGQETVPLFLKAQYLISLPIHPLFLLLQLFPKFLSFPLASYILLPPFLTLHLQVFNVESSLCSAHFPDFLQVAPQKIILLFKLYTQALRRERGGVWAGMRSLLLEVLLGNHMQLVNLTQAIAPLDDCLRGRWRTGGTRWVGNHGRQGFSCGYINEILIQWYALHALLQMLYPQYEKRHLFLGWQ